MFTVQVTADTSDIDELNKVLSEAAARVDKERAVALTRTAHKVRDIAVATVRGYTKGTGALADNVVIGGTPLTRTVGSELREAAFLEFGSPNTGGPRPWLTQPAHLGMTALLNELGAAAEPW